MSQWVDRIRTHLVWPLLESIGPVLDKALEREPIGPEQIDSIERLRAILAFCGKRLAAADPILVFPSALEGMANAFTQLKVHVDAFVASGDVSQLPLANAQADSALANSVSVLGAATADDLTVISAAAASYRTTLEAHLKGALAVQVALAEQAKANEAKIAALEASLTTEQQRLANLITEQQSQFSAAQDKRATDFAAMQADYLAKHTAAAAEQQTQFSSDQDARKSIFSEFQRTSTEKVATFVTNATSQLEQHNKDYTSKVEDFTKNYSDNLAEIQKGYAKKAEDILQEMEGNKKRVEDLVGIIGTDGVTYGYQKVANQARRMLYLWQGLTSLSLLGLISVAILTAFPAVGEMVFGVSLNGRPQVILEAQVSKGVNDPKDKAVATKVDAKVGTAATPQLESSPEMAFYHGLATRIFLAITFGIFAGYAGRQASNFMSVERKNRKLALELEALGPFIEPLSADDQNKFRIQVGERSFGVPDNEAGHDKHKGNDPVTMWDLLKSKELRDAFLDFYNKAKKPEG